ncbi:IucA/IucC family protein [Azospirillum sp. SYSU D00513]|uniref:IucA/IucC family protein n=1 Tax=Azospirillum sp. SYSU D00513 TaxID=2812561 RepID=UPI001A9717E7|nr:IucA/IucC family protein [Azospirillum sp. SYSU D00513]
MSSRQPRSSQQIAEQVTFQSFANCYRREIDAGRLVRHDGADGTAIGAATEEASEPGGSPAGPDCIEWALPSQGAALRAEIAARSLCGPVGFGRLWMRTGTEGAWQPAEPFSALYCLSRESYARFGARGHDLRGSELELLLRVLQSYQSVERYIDAQRMESTDGDDFIAAEQSLVFGHWLHPTPKSVQGMSHWQQPSYAPELHGRFRLRFFAAVSSRVSHRSAFRQGAPEMISAMLGTDGARLPLAEGEQLIPMHPLQAEALLLDPEVRDMVEEGTLRDLGPAGPDFTATSSVRTVYSPDSPWMLKFSLPVRITNSVRLNRRHELEAGVLMAKLIGAIGPSLGARLRFLLDPAYITLDLPGRAESGFEVILRENPFVGGRRRGVVTIAALTADPLPDRPSRLERLVRRLATSRGITLAEASRHWFGRYLACALDPVLSLYDEHGIALEAHQQNGLLDIGQDVPSRFHYRDNQGFYLCDGYRDSLRRHVPEADNMRSLWYGEEEINRRVSYYLIVNQVFSVISRLGKDGLVGEEDLLAMLRGRLESLAPSLRRAGRSFVEGLLDSPTIGAKFNLTTRLLDIDELETPNEGALYAALPNPLHRQAGHIPSDLANRAAGVSPAAPTRPSAARRPGLRPEGGFHAFPS